MQISGGGGGGMGRKKKLSFVKNMFTNVLKKYV